ncbi:MAG: DSD1 family PLP-dependent enzyme [Bryobacteraceae bacterium]
MKLHEIPTPALLLDLERFEANLSLMRGAVSAAGKRLRPHAKAHKCVDVARRQIAYGAAGMCVATVPEAELFASAGIHDILLTSPLASPEKIRRMALLAVTIPELKMVIDHPEQLALYEAAAAETGVRLNLLVDLDCGDHRTGIPPDERAERLVEQIVASPHANFAGLQAYSVKASHVHGFAERLRYSHEALAPAIRLKHRLAAKGIPVPVLTGGSTGTYNIDTQLPDFDEIQAGSYAFMDLDYLRIGSNGAERFRDFAPSLSVLATVVSKSHDDLATVDAGFKSFATDRGFCPQPLEIEGVEYRWAGDEFGILHLRQPSAPVELGTRIEFLVPHCDPTVNLHRHIYVCRYGAVEAVWPIMELPC